MSRDMTCVYRAANIGEADIVAAWLAEQGITAFVKDYAALSLYGPVVASPLGVEVCVANADQAERAAGLLHQHESDIEARKAANAAGPQVEVCCESCGATTVFPHQLRGTVQSCPRCRAYMDLPTTTTG